MEIVAQPIKTATDPKVWLFPSNATSVFAGWCQTEQAFVFGCVIPEKIVDIAFWPGHGIQKDIEAPRTLMLQYLPIFYGERTNIPNTEAHCLCKTCTGWLNHRHHPNQYLKPRTKKIHFGTNPSARSQFCIYELLKKDQKTIIRRLAMGNNKRGQHPTIKSLICWGQTVRPQSLLESHAKFWSSMFSFSYTGKEQNLDNPAGYDVFLKNYKKNSEQVAKDYGDIDLDLTELLNSLNPLICAPFRTGVTINHRGYPRKTPQISWVDRDDESNWYLNGTQVEKVDLQTCMKEI